jgi:hypothetical protein
MKDFTENLKNFDLHNKSHVNAVNEWMEQVAGVLTVLVCFPRPNHSLHLFFTFVNNRCPLVRTCVILSFLRSQAMIMLILATDMARHSEILEAFKAKIDQFDFKNDDHVNSVNEFIFSSVFLSYPTPPFCNIFTPACTPSSALKM